MNVTLPNGKIIRDIPEGTPKEVIMQKAILAGLATQQDFEKAMNFGGMQTQQEQVESLPDPIQVRDQYLQEAAAENASGMSTGETLGTSVIQGLQNIGRGAMDLSRYVGSGPGPLPASVNPFNETSNETLFREALETESPITTAVGQGLGEAVPALPLAMAAGPLALAPRVGAMVGIGAAETGLAAQGRGEDVSEVLSQAGLGGAIAGTAEVVLPIFGRIIGNIYRKLTGKEVVNVLNNSGNVLPEVKGTLEAAGVDIDLLKDQAKKQVARDLIEKGIDPKDIPKQLAKREIDTVQLSRPIPKTGEEIERIARFESQGMPFTPGDISGEFAQRGKEARLLEVQGEAADPLRQLRTTQAKRIEELKTVMSNALGDPDSEVVGEFVKLGLGKSEKIARAERKEIYSLLAEKAGYKNGIPLPTDSIINKIDDVDFQGMANALTDQELNQINNMMVKFGIDTSEEAIDQFTKGVKPGLLGSGDIVELTTKNAEQFNKSLNAMISPTSSPALKGVVGSLTKSVDDGFELIDDAIAPELLGLKRQARESHVKLMQEFSPQSMVGKLTKVKQDGITPMVEASNVFNQLFKSGKTSTIEPLKKVMAQLVKTPEGKKAIGNMQSRLILDVLDSGFNPSDMINGQVMFGGKRALAKLESLGTKEVDQLFSNKPNALAKFKELIQTGVDITPSTKEVVKGSGSVLINALDSISDFTLASKLGPIAGLMTSIKKIARAGADERELKKLYKQNPQLKIRADFIERELPMIAVILGIGQKDNE